MNWTHDVERYASFLRLKDNATSIRKIEFCEDRLDYIRNTYPNQQKIFDMMERES